MRRRYVLVEALVPDYGEGRPEHPIVLPPEEPPSIWPSPGRPAHPIVLPPPGGGGNPPGIWGGPGSLPPWVMPPIYYPPPGGGGSPPGIWGGNDPYPTPPIYFPPGGGPVDPGYGVPGPPYYRPEHPIFYPPGIWPSPGHPAHPIAPGGPIPPVDPGYGVPGPPYWGIWGGSNEGFPTPPIAPGGPPPVVGGGPIIPPVAPIFDPDQLPPHPELPDLNQGAWMIVVKSDGSTSWAFVPWVRAVVPPIYDPKFPPESTQPGEWIVIVYKGTPMNAWMPSSPSDATPPDSGGGGEVPPSAVPA